MRTQLRFLFAEGAAHDKDKIQQNSRRLRKRRSVKPTSRL
jgi:hypothetical protein